MEPVSAGGGESFLRHAIPIELTGSDRFVNASEILKNDAARAQIEMADFGVAHLAFGETDIGAARLDFAAGIDAPAVANDEHYRASHTRALCRRFRGPTSGFEPGAKRLKFEPKHCG